MRWLPIFIATILQTATPSIPQSLAPGQAASARAASAKSDLFSSASAIDVTIAAPLDQLFKTSRQNAEFAVTGQLTYKSDTGQVETAQITVSVRGHTSKAETECEFPKLKLKFARAPQSGPFAGISVLKIGTHCDERADAALSEQYGRWGNEKSPLREALVYRLLAATEVPTLKARAARITYIDAGSSPLVRNAVLVEDDAQALKRFGAASHIDEAQFTSADKALLPRDAARLVFAEAMIGNFDWCLRFFKGDTYRCDDRHPLWNILAFPTSSGLVPVIYDFDLAGMVTGRHTWFAKVFNAKFSASGSEPEVEVLSQLQRTRSLFSRQVLDATRAAFVRNKAAAYQVLSESPLDEGWRPTIEAYLNSFYRAMESDDIFYSPVVVGTNARFFLDAGATRPACGDETVLTGTPVSAPLETRDGMSRVLVLNALWQWDTTTPRTCAAILKDAVWIASNTVSKEYPR